MKTAFIAFAAAIAAAAAHCADEAAVTDSEIWNEGVGYYEAGDVTNALRVLRNLLPSKAHGLQKEGRALSKTHGARAAEVVAKLEYDRGNLEEAADAAQMALRANPEDPQRANRNFTRAVDGLPQLRETKRVDAILKASQGKDPGAMMLAATYEARALLEAAGTYRTNAPARAVALADSLSGRAGKLADAWIPLREAIAQSVTNEEQAATILTQIAQAEGATKKAAEEIGDMSEDGYATMSAVEHDFTRFLKLSALPPQAIAEDEVAQSNAWQDVAAVNGRSWQQDALDYTRAFRAKFPAWARAYEQQAQADTNKPPFTAEAQAKVSGLATELEKVQIECCEKSLPPSQERALAIIREIRELLPKDGGGQGQQNQQQNQQNQQQNQDQQNKQNQDQQQDQQKDKQDQEQSDQRQDQDPEKDDQQKDSDEDQEKPDSREDQEIEATLMKAQERNDEHEAKKKALMRKAPLPPNEKDW